MQTISIIAHPRDNSQIEAVKAFMKALKIKFEISKEKSFTLSREQQQILNSQLNSDKSSYIDAETLYTDLKNKYEL